MIAGPVIGPVFFGLNKTLNLRKTKIESKTLNTHKAKIKKKQKNKNRVLVSLWIRR